VLFVYGVLQVESIVLSIISMLSGPNDESPANVEAAVSLTIFLIYATLYCNLHHIFLFILICNLEKEWQPNIDLESRITQSLSFTNVML
jgi:ubiquitin-protein ligase